MTKKIIFGLGTGRCGTVSLSHLLNEQSNAYFTHERPFLMPWVFENTYAVAKLKQITESPQELTGDVSYYYLPYVQYFLENTPTDTEIFFICLQRDKTETVNSYIRKTQGRNHWMDHDGTQWHKDPNYDPTYPTYNCNTKEESLNLYYDHYYYEAKLLEEKYPEQFRVFDTESLNTSDGVKNILTFVKIEDEKQNQIPSIKKNVAGIDSQESQ